MKFLEKRTAPAGSFLEIGVYYGGTASILLEYFNKGYGVDFGAYALVNQLKIINPNYSYFQADTRAVGDLPGLADGSVELLFIDCTHDDISVRNDYEKFKRYVKPGGLIAFHDIRPDNAVILGERVNVKAVYDELCTTHEHYEFISDDFADSIELLNNLTEPWGGIGVIVNE